MEYCQLQVQASKHAAWAAVRNETDFQWFVIVLTVSGRIRSQHNPSIEWWVHAHIRGRCYEWEIATDKGCKHAAGLEAGGDDFHGSRIRGM
jgi:hypothetical protein